MSNELHNFRYDFTFKEFFQFLKGMKCPNCHRKMIRHKKSELTIGKEVNSKRHPFFGFESEVKHYYFVYECEKCGMQIRLDEDRKPKIIIEE